MAPKFITIQMLLFTCAYFATRQWQLFLVSLTYQLLWIIWFSMVYTPLQAHRAIYTRISAVAWTIVYVFFETLVILRDCDLIESLFYYGVSALLVIFSSATVLAMSCHATILSSEHWSTNVVELCAFVWIAAHDIKGDIIKSGIPLCIAASIVRYVHYRKKTELLFWGALIVAELFVSPQYILYIVVMGMLFVGQFCIYGIKMSLLVIFAPLTFSYLLCKYLQLRWQNRNMGHRDACNQILVDAFDRIHYFKL